MAAVKGWGSPWRSSPVHRAMSTSGAPLETTRQPPWGRRWAVVIIFRAEVKGISPMRGKSCSRLGFSRLQARRNAVSVGSPVRVPPMDWELLHKVASSKANWAAGLSRGCSPWGPAKATTVILFWVRVPVLSEQITWVLPKVSTAGRWRTMARFWAMRLMPMASTMVTTAVRPSGMAATPRLMAIMNISRGSMRWNSPSRKITPQMSTTPAPSTLPVCLSFCCRGVWGAFSFCSIRAIFPMAVSMPVATATPTPAPEATPVEANTIFFRSPRGAFCGQRAWASFSAGRDSPVRADSSVFSSTERSRRKSAGTKSPAWRMTMSPGTSSQLSTRWRLPSRSTWAWGEESFFRASMALSARRSCTVPMTALTTTMAKMMRESTYSPSPLTQDTPKETAAAASKMSTIKSWNWPKNWRSTPRRLAVSSWFFPYLARRRWTSPRLRPRRGSTPRASRASSWLNWKYSILLPLLAGKAYGPLFYQVYAGRGRFMKAAKRAPLSRGPSPLLFTFWPGKRARPWG